MQVMKRGYLIFAISGIIHTCTQQQHLKSERDEHAVETAHTRPQFCASQKTKCWHVGSTLIKKIQ